MARSDGSPGALHRHEGVVAVLAAAVLGVAMLSVPPGPSGYAVPATASRPASAPAPAAPGAPLRMMAPAPGSDPGAPVVEPPPAPAPAAQPSAPAAEPARAPAAPPVPLADDVHQRVQEALDTLGYPWQELGWDIRFEPYTGGLLGLADPATRQITVYVKARSTVQQLRVVLAHEIGHALDVRHPEQRDRYRAVRGIPADTPWYPCDRCEDYDTPAGDFAEVFAAWLVGASDFRSRVAPLPDDAQLRELVPLFAPPSARVPDAQPPPRRARPSPSPSSRPLLGVGSRG